MRTNARHVDGFCIQSVLAGLGFRLAGYFFVLAISNVGYMIFNFLNLNAG